MKEIRPMASSEWATPPNAGLIIERDGDMVLRDGKKNFRTGTNIHILLGMTVGHSRTIGRHGRGYLIVRWRSVIDIYHGKEMFTFSLRDIRAIIKRPATKHRKK